MLTMKQSNEEIIIEKNGETVLSAIWSGYVDQNYHHEVIQEAIIEIPSMGCTIVQKNDEAQMLIDSLRQQSLTIDYMLCIASIFPHVTMSLSHDTWECECCGSITDISCDIKNSQTNTSFCFYHDGHFGDDEKITSTEFVEFCLYGERSV